MSKTFWRFSAFWIFMVLFKFGGGLHFSMLSALGEQVLPLWIVGIIISIGTIFQLILDVPAGYLGDKIGYLRTLKITSLIFILGALCLTFGLNQLSFILTVLIGNFGWLFFGPGVSAYILSHAEKKTSGQFISTKEIFGSIGVVLSTGILGFAVGLAPATIGLIITISMGLAFISLFFAPKDTHKAVVNDTPHHQNNLRRNALRKTLSTLKSLSPASIMLVLVGFAACTFYAVIWFIIPLVIAHQSNGDFLSASLSVFDLSVVILGYFIGKIADHNDKRQVVFIGLLIFAVSGMLLSFNFNWLFLIFGFLATTGDELASISLWSWLHNLDENHQHDGLISGTITFFEDLGWAIGPLIAGALYDPIGPTLTIALSSGLLIVVWLIYRIFFYHQHPAKLALHRIKPARKLHRG